MTRIMLWLIYGMLAFGALCIIYVIAPILIPLITVIGGLGGLTWGIVTASRALERRVHGETSSDDSDLKPDQN